MIDLSEVERSYLSDLLERRYEELLHEMHHTASRKFRDGLKDEIAMVERMRLGFSAGQLPQPEPR